jgi:hypothetical protein
MHRTRPQQVSLRRVALGGLLALLISTITMIPLAPTANASPGPGDDRQLSAVTGWWTYTGQSASALSSKLTANGGRLTDLRVESVSGTGVPTFTAVMVKNSSSYASGWWWYYGLTAAQVNTQLSNHTARPISVQGYGTPSGLRFAVIMVDNSGARFKAYSWWYGTATFINSHVTSTNRLISFSSILGTSSYVGVFTDNSGTNATGWWWYYGKSTSQISALLTTNHARIVDLDRNTNGTYNVVMYSNRSTRWYWYYGQSISTAVARALQQGERIIDVTPYFVGGVKFFAVVSTNNLNSLSGKLWSIVAPRIDSGSYGFYLKQVGGSTTLAGVQSTLKYEPASALKVLYHAKSIHQEALGTTTDSTVITYHYNPADTTNGGICPDDYASTNTTNLKNADTLMMQNSDNRMTRGVLEKYTKPAMLSYAAALGLTSTSINHNIGCPTSATHNYTTLVDLGRIYEAFQNGTVTTNATWKSQFRSRMLNESNYSGFKNLICPIVQQEASSLGKSATVATNFCNAMTFIAKGGDYAYGGSLPRYESHDDVWLAGLPYKARGTIAPRYFVLGEFVDEVHIDSPTEFDAMNAARSKLKQEALRPSIRAALTTW